MRCSGNGSEMRKAGSSDLLFAVVRSLRWTTSCSIRMRLIAQSILDEEEYCKARDMIDLLWSRWGVMCSCGRDNSMSLSKLNFKV